MACTSVCDGRAMRALVTLRSLLQHSGGSRPIHLRPMSMLSGAPSGQAGASDDLPNRKHCFRALSPCVLESAAANTGQSAALPKPVRGRDWDDAIDIPCQDSRRHMVLSFPSPPAFSDDVMGHAAHVTPPTVTRRVRCVRDQTEKRPAASVQISPPGADRETGQLCRVIVLSALTPLRSAVRERPSDAATCPARSPGHVIATRPRGVVKG